MAISNLLDSSVGQPGRSTTDSRMLDALMPRRGW
jgi:hypothetical protein